jgi:hypothetical protein
LASPAGHLTGDIGSAVLARLDGPRRPASAPARSNPRSAAGTSNPKANPRTYHRITSITRNIDPRHYQPPTRQPKSVTNTDGP